MPLGARHVPRRPGPFGPRSFSGQGIYPGPTFPTTAILDSFTRANAGNLGANWHGDPWGFGYPDFSIVSNAAAAAASWNSSAWNTIFGPNTEVFVTSTIFTAIYHELFARINGFGAAFNGYSLRWDGSFMYVMRYDGGVATQLGVNITQPVVSGNRIGFSIIGNVITVYFSSDASWNLVATRTDTTYNNAGYIGMLVDNGPTDVLDNFGGGSFLEIPFIPSTQIVFSSLALTGVGI